MACVLTPPINSCLQSFSDRAAGADICARGDLALIGAGCGGSGAQPAAASEQLSTKELVRRSKPAIARITVRAKSETGVGTGFVIDASGDIVTNLHVIAGAEEIEVQLADGTSLPVDYIKGYDVERDLAIVRVKTESKLPVLQLGDSDEVAAGDPVVAIGNPLGVLDFTVSDGLISSVRQLSESVTVLQISAPISQGSSGGPLFDPRGRVIGVVRAFISQGQNLNFGIPSNYLRSLQQRAQRISLDDMNNQLAEEMARKAAERRPAPSGGNIARKIPYHATSTLDSCPDSSLQEAQAAIENAIGVGAPIYNSGNHEGCFRIYEGAALRLERESACKAVREALGQGMLRASTLEGGKLKAWAMRDAFDGLLDVMRRKRKGL